MDHSDTALCQFFKRYSGRLPISHGDESQPVLPVVFDRKSLPAPPMVLVDSEVMGVIRQRYTSYGLIDNVILQMDRSRARAVGLWLLSCALRPNRGRYALRLESPSSDIRRLIVEPGRGREAGVRYSIDAYIWEPSDLEQWAQCDKGAEHLGQKPVVGVTNEDHDWATREEFEARDVLGIYGESAGICLLAAFFLNFGLPSCPLNYEYINYERGASITEDGSCELRVELIR